MTTTTFANLAPVRKLVAGYLGLSLLTVGILALLGNSPEADSQAWSRAVIVAASSMLTMSMAVLASRGSHGAFIRLRVATAVMLAAIVVFVVAGDIPVWLKLEQAVCGVLLARVVVLVNSRRH